MPELSRFYGIVIRMYSEPGNRHHAAHFHAYYGEDSAIFDLDSLSLLAGTMPTAQRRLVEAWAEIHRAELAADWERLRAGQAATPIEPLR